MQRTIVAAVLATCALAGCRSGDVGVGNPAPEMGTAQPAPADVLPVGAVFDVELDQTIDTEESEVGDRFTATVKDPVVRNGMTMIPAGARVHGRITGLDDSDHIGDQAAIRLDFETITFNGRTHPLRADITDADIEFEGVAGIEEVAKKAGIGAAAGAALGAIIGGDLKDILVGGALGAGAGTVVSLGLGEVEAALPRGTDLTLRTTQSIEVR
jgi:hypothetical protein